MVYLRGVLFPAVGMAVAVRAEPQAGGGELGAKVAARVPRQVGGEVDQRGQVVVAQSELAFCV